MPPDRLVIRPIDFALHAPLCVAFRRDSFICSFGVDDFMAEAAPDGATYIEKLTTRASRLPDGYVHCWHDGIIVGQMEMQILDEPSMGYVNLFYLIEAMRGRGVSGELQGYAMRFCRRHGVHRAQLSVSPTNLRARAFYAKHGWRDLGVREGHERVHLMECDVPA